MTRIIPWTLPPVKGGSIGGYTPAPTPEPPEPDPDPVYVTADNLAVQSRPAAPGKIAAYFSNGASISAGSSRTSGLNGAGLTITGIELVNAVGISTIKVAVYPQKVAYNLQSYLQVTVTTDEPLIVMNYDYMTKAATYLSSVFTATLKNNAASTTSSINSAEFIVDHVVIYVYNGNGEILQQLEVQLA